MFTGYDIALIRTVKDWERVRPRFEVAPLISLDLETASLTDHTVWGIPMAVPLGGGKDGLAIYIGLKEDIPTDSELSFKKHLGPWLEWMFEDDEREWVGHNLKFDTNVFRSNGFRRLPSKIFDTMVGSWMVRNQERRHSLELVARRELHIDLTKDLMEIRKLRDTDRELYWTEMLRYGVGDGVVPLKLRAKFVKEMLRMGLARAAKDLEMPLVEVVGELETRGVRVDMPALTTLRVKLASDVASLQLQVHDTIGYEFNLGSPSQLSDALFDSPDGLQLEPQPWMERGKPRKIKANKKLNRPAGVRPGAYKTNVQVLKSYTDPICESLLTWRTKKKIIGTYIDPFMAKASVDPNQRVHAGWHQTGTTTGRFSSSRPNLQNLPRGKGLIRKAIIADPGFVFVTCDYSQIELRLMAHQSNDATMLAAYHAGADLHKRTAAQALGVAESAVTEEMRQIAKAVNFGYIYGMSWKRFKDYAWLQYGVRVSDADAKKFREVYFELYPGIKDYHDSMWATVLEKGYTENIIGERRFLPGHNSADGYERWQAWSEGVNYTIQGSAAAMMKVAMLNCYQALERPFGKRISTRYGRAVTLWNSPNDLAHEVRLVMQVHDEMVWEVRKKIAPQFALWVKGQMETAITGFRCPMLAEVGIGANLEAVKKKPKAKKAA